jgi:hypothetical protein
VIATSGGRASLSQLQIVIWTMVVGASMAYVFSMTGVFIPVSEQVLALLGISGAALVGAKAKSVMDGEPLSKLAPGVRFPVTDLKVSVGGVDVPVGPISGGDTLASLCRAVNRAIKAAGAGNAVHDAKVDLSFADANDAPAQLLLEGDPGSAIPALTDQAGLVSKVGVVARTRVRPAADSLAARLDPKWSDLVLNDGELDVSRMQMLFFTLIIAIFVVIKVAANHTIPELPDSFMALMGISNGIYLLSKFVPPRRE